MDHHLRFSCPSNWNTGILGGPSQGCNPPRHPKSVAHTVSHFLLPIHLGCAAQIDQSSMATRTVGMIPPFLNSGVPVLLSPRAFLKLCIQMAAHCGLVRCPVLPPNCDGTRNFLTFVNTTGSAYAAKTRCMRPTGKYLFKKA